ncbi:peptide deformylase [Waddlia chondrophila 2032/99]|uniref:Peptide deformylase n=2 Tax=Waddlia chondrophila TaxID=71667 RepID=D6YWJ9_WADCW|nr:peptide deformylase [Waddlia chondrophila]ADI38510.1 polypeptide deformylase [Waddlia chondrophila WSU 86-1044]CCB91592.1 peptide deformylase [Waddlia chondrophila 2032/99]
MKLELAYYGDPFLRKKCKPVEEINNEIRELVENMVETLVEYNGIGLAAPQIKQDLRLFITAVPKELPNGDWEQGELIVFINPEIVSYSEETEDRQEGCLSIPKLYGNVNRPVRIVIKATDMEGNVFERKFEGLQARCCLHENDHINGVLYIDRIRGKERKLLEPKLREIKKKFS